MVATLPSSSRTLLAAIMMVEYLALSSTTAELLVVLHTGEEG